MDYKEAYELLLEKLEKEAMRAENYWKKKHPEGFNRPDQDSTKNLDWYEFEEVMREFGNERYSRGQMICLGNAAKFARTLKEEVEKKSASA